MSPSYRRKLLPPLFRWLRPLRDRRLRWFTASRRRWRPLRLRRLRIGVKRTHPQHPGKRKYAVGIFLCPAAGVKSNWKSRFVPDISNRPRYTSRCPPLSRVYVRWPVGQPCDCRPMDQADPAGWSESRRTRTRRVSGISDRMISLFDLINVSDTQAGPWLMKRRLTGRYFLVSAVC
jgi:hypothetical protein